MRLALVGNGRVGKDYSRFIDGCDLVIRCNEAKNLGENVGFKTDVLCITNTGAPARRLIDSRSVQRQPRFPGIKEVWFPRDSGVHLGWLERLNLRYPRSEFVDIGDRIIQANDLEDVRVRRFSRDLNRVCFGSLARASRKPFVCPSTGFMAFVYVTRSGNFDGFEKFLFGFTFEMWDGHPADSERLLVHEAIASRGDIKLVNQY